jgi:hypothetical protein
MAIRDSSLAIAERLSVVWMMMVWRRPVNCLLMAMRRTVYNKSKSSSGSVMQRFVIKNPSKSAQICARHDSCCKTIDNDFRAKNVYGYKH